MIWLKLTAEKNFKTSNYVADVLQTIDTPLVTKDLGKTSVRLYAY